MKRLRLLASLAAVALFPTLRSHADVTLPRMLSSHMVLQRDRPIHRWGWADPGEPVTATLKDKSATVKTDELGRWSLYLPAERAGGPYQVTIAGRNRIVLDDVLIGDVWFASGQSNMEFPLLGFGPDTPLANGTEEIRNATQPQIRLMLVDRVPSPFPLQDVNTDPQGSSPKGWTLCTPETAAHFSAAAYFFGREIATKEHVPVGLIDSSWGGTPAEAWVSMQGLADPALSSVFAQWARESANLADVPRMQAEEKREDEAAAAAGKPKPQHPWHPDMRSWDPAWLYNGMIAPFTPMPIKGVIWYQGETNSSVERALDYQRIFPALIEDWRRHWGQGDFPFLFVQISSFRSTASEDWPVIREAQRRTLKLAKTAMAVTIDIGNPANVHPADKQDVGHRLALAAEAVAYGAPVEDSGPLFREATPVGGAIEVRFDHGEGLTAKGGELTGFEVAGKDRNFVKAEAKIGHGEAGAYITVASPAVSEPVYVRYGWQNAPSPTLNLYNAAGLPASPFTSEQEIPAPDPAHPTN